MFDWFWELLYGLMKSLFFCVDFMLDIAGMLCGVEPITVNGQKQDLVYYFITNDMIVGAFEAILVIGFILLFIFTAYSVFRSMGKLGEGKSAIHICLDSAKTLLYFFLVPAIMSIGVVVVSTVMTSVYEATAMGETSLGGMLFSATADGAWYGSGNKEDVMNQFIAGKSGYDYTSFDDVREYFNLEKMDYLIGFLSSAVVLVLIALSLFSFVERIIGIVFLFLVAPLSMSTAPLDEGARFKMWRDQVINKFLIAYGALLSINIFMLLVHTVRNVQFFEGYYLNLLAQVAFLIGGAFACRKGTVMAGNLINAGAGTADKMENASAAGGLRGLAGFVAGRAFGGAGKVLGSVAHAIGMPLRHVEKDVKSWAHRSSNAKRSAKDEQSRQKYVEKLSAADPKQKRAGAQGSAGQSASGRSSQNALNQTLQNKKSVDPNNRKFDEKSQRQSDKSQIAALQNKKSIDPNNKKSDEKPQATTSSKDKEKPSMAKALSGMQQNAVNTAKEQSPQQTAKPMNEHLQGKVTGAIQGRATGKDGNGR